MKTHFETVLVGATYYALGYASSHTGCLILEENQTVGGDFHPMLHPVRTEAAGETEKASELGQLMIWYGVWTEAGFDLLKAAPVAHEYAAQLISLGRDILLDCRILSVQKDGRQFTVRYFCNEGICEVKADRVVDTTVSRVTEPDSVRCTKKTLNVFTVCNHPGFNDILKGACPDCEILEGFCENEKLMRFPAEPGEETADICRRVAGIWKTAFPAGEEKILLTADIPDAVYESTGEGTATWNGGRFEHPAAAFVKGRDAR